MPITPQETSEKIQTSATVSVSNVTSPCNEPAVVPKLNEIHKLRDPHPWNQSKKPTLETILKNEMNEDDGNGPTFRNNINTSRMDTEIIPEIF